MVSLTSLCSGGPAGEKWPLEVTAFSVCAPFPSFWCARHVPFPACCSRWMGGAGLGGRAEGTEAERGMVVGVGLASGRSCFLEEGATLDPLLPLIRGPSLSLLSSGTQRPALTSHWFGPTRGLLVVKVEVHGSRPLGFPLGSWNLSSDISASVLLLFVHGFSFRPLLPWTRTGPLLPDGPWGQPSGVLGCPTCFSTRGSLPIPFWSRCAVQVRPCRVVRVSLSCFLFALAP